MARRVALPSVDDLFRLTEDGEERARLGPVRVVPDRPAEVPQPRRPTVAETVDAQLGNQVEAPVDNQLDNQLDNQVEAQELADQRAASGRVRHDEKMTVYVTSSELLAIEHARLVLRGEYGLAVDRGRLVREAIALVLADLHVNGEGSALVRRLIDED